MNPFRRKSDVKRTAIHDTLHASQSSEVIIPAESLAPSPGRSPVLPLQVQQVRSPSQIQPLDLLPGLPPASDFRTSLILPDLSRRFTLLRKPGGDLATVNDLKSKFAEQRAKGAENQITEEEEEMILETLGRIRAKNAGSRGGGTEDGNTTDSTQVSASQQSLTSSTSSPNSRSAKRYSNNLFSSGRFRDYAYMRSTNHANKRSKTDSINTMESTSGRENASENTASTVEQSASLTRSVSLTVPNSNPEVTDPANIEKRTSWTTPALNRASLALAEAMNKIEETHEDEEAEEEIVMPRISPPLRLSHATTSNDTDMPNVNTSELEAGTAITWDKPIIADDEIHRSSPVTNVRPGSVSPTRLPGYIPGMPRPMTPRDLDPDEQRSTSTTPRAISPSILPGLIDRTAVSPSSFYGGIRRAPDVSAASQTPRPVSPASPSANAMMHSRSPNGPNGRSTPEEGGGASGLSGETEVLLSSILASRRRPMWSASGPAFQPLAVSSRPGTPSNVVWNVSPSPSPQKNSGHRRNGSSVDDVLTSGNKTYTERERSSSRLQVSSVLPDPPMTDVAHEDVARGGAEEENARTAHPRAELGSPYNRLRSPTPTQGVPPRSLISPTFSNHDSPTEDRSPSPGQSHLSESFNTPFSIPRSTLVFSPIANSSRSSLESEGSSYHSWDGGLHKSNTLLADLEQRPSPWHDLSANTDKSSPSTSDDTSEAEDVIKRYAGLTKSDFVAIQEKLVGAAYAKAATPPARDRAPSLRRRRPSTSQSNYSNVGNDNKFVPASPMQISIDQRPKQNSNVTKASTLLTSVIDSIQSHQGHTSSQEGAPHSPSEFEFSTSSNRRHKDLADALFGPPDNERNELPPKLTTTVFPPTILQSSPPTATSSQSEHGGVSSPSSVALAEGQSPQTPLTSPLRPDLVKEVQRKTEAAMAELRRNSENTNPEGYRVGGFMARKRVHLNQISEPRLVSASTSVDAVPLRSPPSSAGQQPSKISERFRLFRGSLRGKSNTLNSDEVTPYPYDIRPAASPTGRSALSPTNGGISPGLMPITPASAGPSLKGFLGRLRRPRTGTSQSESDHRLHPYSQSATASTSSTVQFDSQYGLDSLKSAPPTTGVFSASPHRPVPSGDPHFADENVDANESMTETEDTVAKKRFLDAALTLGLDEDAVNALLARRGTSRSNSRPFVSRQLSSNNAINSSPARPPMENGTSISPSATNASSLPSHHNGVESTRAQKLNGSSAADGQNIRGDDVSTVRRPSIRRRGDIHQEDRGNTNAIVRRTIIFPSDGSSTLDLNVLLRRQSQSKSRRRSSSVASIRSGRSVHDRVPTPPPHLSSIARRSRPPPKLPPTPSENLAALPVSVPGAIEKSSSTYDSLYDMYSEEGRVLTPVSNELEKPSTEQSLPSSEPGSALEVIELANGEVIWSIVKGLRDEDAESTYPSRVSFASEYSVQESSGEGVQVMFKEQPRSNSRVSASSFAPSKFQGKDRPETKVFYSPSAQIGRLIENLSASREAGTFNFNVPNSLPGRPNPSSYHSSENGLHWTVEEALDHMLKSITRS